MSDLHGDIAVWFDEAYNYNVTRSSSSAWKERKVGGKRYEARSRGRSSPDTQRPDDRADYCLDCSFLPQWKHWVLVFNLEWNGRTVVRARPDEHSQRTGPPSNAD